MLTLAIGPIGQELSTELDWVMVVVYMDRAEGPIPTVRIFTLNLPVTLPWDAVEQRLSEL